MSVSSDPTGLWTAAEAQTATGGEATGAWTATGVSIDSRTVDAGDLFVAIRGPRLDGHAFVADALERGAAAAMVAERPEGIEGDAPLLIVPDTLKGLEDLGIVARARTRARIIGITGSVGKTGTKEALRHCLNRQGKAFATEGSLNNHWGVPLSLARLPADNQFAVFELGMNHAGELGPLSRMVRPEVAVITTVEPAHLEFFGTVEAIADAKAEIFQGLTPGGTAVLNRDNPQFDRLAAAAKAAGVDRIASFGDHVRADARLIACTLLPARSEVIAEVNGREVRYLLPLPGRHLVINSLAVLLAAAVVGADPVQAAADLASLTAVKGRGVFRTVRRPEGRFTLIDESYNASPAAMNAAIAVLGGIPLAPEGRRIAVLGDMLELGGAATALHAALAQSLIDARVDAVYCCGPLMRALFDALPADMRGGWEPGSSKLAARAGELGAAGNVVLVKGSAGSNMNPVVAALAALDIGTARSDPRG